MTDLPSGWAIGPLSDFISPRGEKVAPSAFPDLPFIGMDHVEAHTTRILGSVPSSELKSNAARFFENDVLYGRLRPYLNKVAQPKFDGLASAEFIIFGGNELIYPAFLRHRLNARDFVAFATSLNAGDRPRVNFEQIGDFQILVPPLKEQRRIVEKIEAMFDEIDKGVESLQTARTTLGLYRQSLLKSAFEGRLTADWRAQNADKLEAPETLLARIQKERDARYKAALDAWQDALAQWRADGEKGKKPAKPKRPDEVSSVESSEADEIGQIPSDWAWVRPSLIAEPTPHAIGIGPFGSNLKVSDYRDEGIPLVFVRNITQEDFSLSQKFVSAEKAAELDAHSIKAGDVLVTKMGDPPGDCTVYPVDGPYAIITADCLKFRVWDQFADRRFVSFMIRSNAVKRQLGLITQGVAQKKISVARFKTIALPLPSLAEQTEIVRILDARLEAADALEAEINAALTRADALRQSILKKAFSGQLVPQDPDDEPASALLERIKEEKAERDQAAKRDRKSAPPRKPKARRPTLTDLIEVLEKQKSWVSAAKAAQELGIGDGSASDDVEAFYRQLKGFVEDGAIEVDRRGDEDWLRLAKAEVT